MRCFASRASVFDHVGELLGLVDLQRLNLEPPVAAAAVNLDGLDLATPPSPLLLRPISSPLLRVL